jgi:hypothetical protein
VKGCGAPLASLVALVKRDGEHKIKFIRVKFILESRVMFLLSMKFRQNESSIGDKNIQ